MKIGFIYFFASALALPVLADEKKTSVYQQDFENVKVGEAPEAVMEIEGAFTVVEEDGKKFLRVGVEPLAENGIVLGPSMKAGGTVEAKIRSFKKRRSYPRFGVGLHGISGYRLRVVPSSKKVELLRNEEVVVEKEFMWKPDTWTNLKLEIKQSGDKWSIRAWVWPVAEGDEGKQPKQATLEHSDEEPPGQGKASLWGTPYSGRPVDFDDVKVTPEAG